VKLPRKVHSRKEKRSHAGEVSTDLYGPFPEPTVEGSFYLQVYVRVGSGHMVIYGCKRKNSCVENFNDYLRKWPPPLTSHYHSDGAPELIGAEIQKLADKFSPSIILTHSPAYSPNQNCYAERSLRTLADMSHPNLVLSGLPFRFIEKCMIYSAQVHNMLPRQTDRGWMSPHEYEYGTLPDFSRLRRWGCLAYYHVPVQLRRKGDIENGKKAFFMCLSIRQPHGWVLWDPKLNDFIVSSNVHFVESVDTDLLESLATNPKSKKIREVDLYVREYDETPKSITDFQHLIGKQYYDPDDREVYETVAVRRRGQVIVAYRKKVIYGRTVGDENDNHPIHVRDVEAMLSDSRFSHLVAVAELVADPEIVPLVDKSESVHSPDKLTDHQHVPTAARRASNSRKLDVHRDAEFAANIEGTVLPERKAKTKRVPIPTPRDVDDALESEQSKKWYPAMFDEVSYIAQEKLVWEQWFGVLPPGVKPLGTRFVFKVKEKDDPEDDIYRARLVVQGFDQIFGVNYDETFSPTTKANILRLYLYFVLLFDMTLPVHLDAVKAYMNSDIDADIWVLPPKDTNEVFFKKGTIFKLKKALYGLKQAGRLWHNLVHEMLLSLGFQTLKTEPCFYYSVLGNVLTFIIVYVDDILLSSQSEEIRDLILAKIMSLYDFTNEGVVSEFLGIRIQFYVDNFQRFVTLDQEKMILAKIEEFDLFDEPISTIPMDPKEKLSTQDEPADKDFPYRELIGSALHIARWTRCDIANTVSKLSSLNNKPTRKAVKAVKRLWAYLRGTAHLKFQLSLSNIRKAAFLMRGYSDSDWAGDIDSRRSTTGWMVFIGLALINWISSLQSFIAQSSMEAETIAANKLLNELLYLQNMFIEAGLLPGNHSSTPIFIDNQAAIQSAHNPVGHGKTKHFDIQQFHLRENVNSGRIRLEKIDTSVNPSDLLTKSLYRPTLEAHRETAGVREVGKSAKRYFSESDWRQSKEHRRNWESGK